MSTSGSPPLSIEHFRSTLTYRKRAPLTEVQADLATISTYDRDMEALESHARNRTTWFGVGTVLFVILTVVAAIFLPPLAMVTGLGGVALFIAAVRRGMQWSKYARGNVENRRYLLVDSLLRYLATDMAADAPVDVVIDFHNYREGRFLKAQEKGGFFSNTSAFAYQVPWLSLAGKLLDGNRFELSVTMLVKRKEKRKRKYTKVREVFRERVELQLNVKAARYPGLAELAQRIAQVQLKGPLEPLAWSVAGSQVTVRGLTRAHLRSFGRGQSQVATPPSSELLHLDDGLQLLVTAYQGLSLCRSPGKAA